MDYTEKKLEKLKMIEKTIRDESIGLEISEEDATQIRTVCFEPSLSVKLENKTKLEYKNISPLQGGNGSQSLEKKEIADVVTNHEKRKSFFQTNLFPQSAFGLVIVKNSANDTVKWGSGVMIGPDIVLTSAHILYYDEKPDKKIFPHVKFVPGATGNEAPLGEFEVEHVISTEHYLDKIGETGEGLNPRGFALLVLKRPIGKATGYLGLNAVATKHTYLLEEKEIFIMGYNEISKEGKETGGSFEQWEKKARTNKLEEGERKLIQYNCGGLIDNGVLYFRENDEFFVIGMHIMRNENSNLASLITKEQYQYLCKLITDAKMQKIDHIFQTKEDEYGILKSLNLKRRYLRQWGLEALLEYKLNSLEDVNLEKNVIDEKGIEELCSKTEWKNLRRLNLSENEFGNAGCLTISRNTSWQNLKSLILKDNKISSDGLIKMVENQNWCDLEEIGLTQNQIDDQGVVVMANNTTWIKLRRLWSCHWRKYHLERPRRTRLVKQ